MMQVFFAEFLYSRVVKIALEDVWPTSFLQIFLGGRKTEL